MFALFFKQTPGFIIKTATGKFWGLTEKLPGKKVLSGWSTNICQISFSWHRTCIVCCKGYDVYKLLIALSCINILSALLVWVYEQMNGTLCVCVCVCKSQCKEITKAE